MPIRDGREQNGGHFMILRVLRGHFQLLDRMLRDDIGEQPIGLIPHDLHLLGVPARLHIAEEGHAKCRFELWKKIHNGDGQAILGS